MCGIAGFWAPDLPGADAGALISAMAAALRHRGPDGGGEWEAGAGGPVFGHRRLAILDLSPAGLQPMRSASDRFVMTFNGEVYNFLELRAALEARGCAPAWRGSSDTEVMLAAIEAWGLEAAVQRFVGMFAFALWDAERRELALVRDRLGVKPLYYAVTPRGLCFASELKSLRLFPGFSSELDPVAVAGYVRANCVPGLRTIFRGTSRVEPGTFLTFASPTEAPRTTRYWSAAEVALQGLAAPFQGTAADATDELDRLLRDAVKLRMVADVPLGAFLSGGVDSSTVVALMQAQSARPVHTFSIENEPAAFDEGDAARAVARHLGTHHTPFTVTAADALAVIPRLPAMFDEPFADSSQVPTYLVSQLARRDVTVALSGDGGDELFGGYVRHVWAPRVWGLQRHLPLTLRHFVARWISGRSPDAWDRLFARGRPFLPSTRIAGIRMHKLASILGAASPREIFQILASHWLPGDRVLARDFGAQADVDLDTPLEQHAVPGDLLDDPAHYMMFRDLVGYLPDDILTKVDRASMAVSLEAREPLLDHRLVAFAWRLPLRFKVRGATGKWILRRVLARYVPERLVSTPKMGFGVPLGDWLRGPLRGWAEALLDERRLAREGTFSPAAVRTRWTQHLRGERPWEYHLWDILMFQAWREANAV